MFEKKLQSRLVAVFHNVVAIVFKYFYEIQNIRVLVFVGNADLHGFVVIYMTHCVYTYCTMCCALRRASMLLHYRLPYCCDASSYL